MNIYCEIIISMFIGYIIGSIPFALVIGKIFYKTDVRKFGSGNLGGSNTGRVLGKKAGLLVMILDVLKVVFASFLCSFFKHSEITIILAGFMTTIGHCYPIFAHFKGGKAVATMFGFLLSHVLLVAHNPFVFFLPLILFLIVLYIAKVVSISSICSAIFSTLYIFFKVDKSIMFIATLLVTCLLIYRHRSNIIKFLKGEENKISWM